MTRFQTWAAIVLGALLTQSTMGINAITTITTDGSDPFNTETNLTSIDSDGRTHTNFVTPASAASTLSSTDFFWGAGEAPAAKPTSVLDALGTDLASGLLNPNSSGGFGLVNAVFPDLIRDDGTGAAEVFIFNPDSGPGEDWIVRAIVGGTAAAPILGGLDVLFSHTDMGDTNQTGTHRRDSGGNFTQDVFGVGLSLSDFGVASLIGIQIQTPPGTSGNGGDPSVIAAITVPEPASATLLVLAMAGMVRRRRAA